jgi:hypothetical protein
MTRKSSLAKHAEKKVYHPTLAVHNEQTFLLGTFDAFIWQIDKILCNSY